MKQLITLLFVCILASGLYSQTRFYEFIEVADSLYDAEIYAEAGSFYEKAFRENPEVGVKWQYLRAAHSWAAAGENQQQALEYLQESIARGMYNLEKLDIEERLVNLREHQDWEKVRNALIDTKEKFEQNLNKPIQEQLVKINAQDQTLRKLYQLAMKELETDEAGRKYYSELIKQEDSICLAAILDLLETHGWLGISDVGEEGSNAIWLVIQHAPLEIQEKYAPLMKAALDKKEATPSNYAYLVDRIRMRKGEPQLYGSQYRSDRKTRERYFYRIEDHKNVNKRREAVGLFPIEKYARLINLKYDPSGWED